MLEWDVITEDKGVRRRPPRAAGLKSVAEDAGVPILTVYHALSNTETVDEATRSRVRRAAENRGYSLRVTIRDVAALANVSVSTVSYVLNANPLIHPMTRQRVEDAIQALGYRPNSTARNLQASETRLIGYAWHRVQDEVQRNPILDRFLYEVAQTAESHGYHMLTFAQSAVHEEKSYESLIGASRVDGFVLSDIGYNDPRIRRLQKLRFPFVAFGRANADWEFPYADDDGCRGISLVVEHLLAQGHRRIAMMSWPDGTVVGDTRAQGYRAALAKAGVDPEPAWLPRTPNDVSHALETARQVLSLPLRPTAIVCATDIMAIGVRFCLEGLGLVMGRDVAVTGYDDTPVAEALGLTSVRQQVDVIARAAAGLLLAEIGGTPPSARHILVEPRLIVRASSAAPLRP
jgi:DNA-binding LacI/PurR family transcriptional regulator